MNNELNGWNVSNPIEQAPPPFDIKRMKRAEGCAWKYVSTDLSRFPLSFTIDMGEASMNFGVRVNFSLDGQDLELTLNSSETIAMIYDGEGKYFGTVHNGRTPTGHGGLIQTNRFGSIYWIQRATSGCDYLDESGNPLLTLIPAWQDSKLQNYVFFTAQLPSRAPANSAQILAATIGVSIPHWPLGDTNLLP